MKLVDNSLDMYFLAPMSKTVSIEKLGESEKVLFAARAEAVADVWATEKARAEAKERLARIHTEMLRAGFSQASVNDW